MHIGRRSGPGGACLGVTGWCACGSTLKGERRPSLRSSTTPGEPCPRSEATPADLEWADGYALGSPTRFGTPAAQTKRFIDTLGGLWFTGKLASRGATAFTSAQNVHGGAESTILTFFDIFSHFGAVIVPPGCTDPLLFEAGGNPDGVSNASGGKSATASEAELAAGRYQGRRLAEATAKLAA